MRIVSNQFKILEFELVNIFHCRVQFHLRQGSWFARELELRLIKMVGVEVEISKCVNKRAGLQAADLRHHEREQRVGCEVERHTEKQICAALVELTA